MFGKASAVLSAVLPLHGFGRRLLQVLSAGMLLPFLFAGHASAATFTVTTLNDSGAGSLRAAITSVSAGDTIVFQSGLTGTITLASALPTINANLTIQGPGADSLTISGNNAVTVFTINFRDGRHLRVNDCEWEQRLWRRYLQPGHADGDQQHFFRQLCWSLWRRHLQRQWHGHGSQQYLFQQFCWSLRRRHSY